jgi:sulfur oxidation c-type cytochrome SoxA
VRPDWQHGAVPHELHLNRFGPAGPAQVLMIHGLTGHGWRWHTLANEHLAEFTVLAPDLLGHGRSSWEAPWTIDANVTALATWVSAESKGLKFNLSQSHTQEKTFYEVGKRLFFQRGGTHDFSCASCHGEEGKRIRLQDLPILTKSPGDGLGFAAWPAYRVSNGQMWSMQLRLNDCYRQQRFPYPGFASEATIALSTYLGVNAKGAASIAPALKR